MTKRFRPDLTVEQEISFLQKLFFLGARDHIYFCRPSDNDPHTKLGDEFGFYILEKPHLSDEDIDLFIRLYEAFGHSGLDAYGDNIENWLKRDPEKEGEAYKEALAWLRNPNPPPLPIRPLDDLMPSPGNTEFVVSNYPTWGRIWPDLPAGEELAILQKVVPFAADDVVFFATYDKSESDIRGTNTWTVNAKPAINTNDVFVPGADAERLPLEKLDFLLDLYQRFGYDGLVAWISRRDGIKPWRWKPAKFEEATAWLEENDG